MTMYKVLSQQSLFDISIEVYGDVEGVFWLMADNGLGLTDRLRAGQELKIRADKISPRQAAYLADFGPFRTIEESDKPVGIGYWHLDEYIVK